MIVEQCFDRPRETAHGPGRIGIPDILVPDFLHDGCSFCPLPNPFTDSISELVLHVVIIDPPAPLV